MFDLLIRNGDLFDGTGAPGCRADVAVAGRRIAALGNLAAAEARRIIDADGQIVCPGFIDAHSHSDTYLLVDPRAVSKITQGITTEVCGNCGVSGAPRLGACRLPSDWADKGYPAPWSTLAEFRALLQQTRPAPNAVLLVGHNTLRASVLGYGAQAAGPDDLAAMARLLEQCLEEGARGLSTGLIYPPGMFAEPAEIHALAAVAARHNGLYTSHMRSESRGLLEAIGETLAVTRATGVRTQISHLKTSGRAHWGLLDEVLARLRAAREQGLPVAADRYPYTSSSTDLDVVFPPWAQEGGRDAVLARLRDPAARARLREEILASRSAESWGTITVGSTRAPHNAGFRGRPLEEAARTLGLEPVDALLLIVERDELATTAFFAGMSEENLWRILAEPWVMLGTDASLRAPDGPLSQDYPHPRAYGSFPRFLRASLDGRTVPLPEAIRKMTSLPAAQFGLSDRGRLAPGNAADLLVVDPKRIADRSTYGEPHRLSEGVTVVIVNGCLTWEYGRFTGDRAGEIL